MKEGIDNMDDIVMKSNQNKMGIDWKLAYMELQRITRMMKWDAKQRGRNTHYIHINHFNRTRFKLFLNSLIYTILSNLY